jgi:hypothetical protein
VPGRFAECLTDLVPPPTSVCDAMAETFTEAKDFLASDQGQQATEFLKNAVAGQCTCDAILRTLVIHPLLNSHYLATAGNQGSGNQCRFPLLLFLFLKLELTIAAGPRDSWKLPGRRQLEPVIRRFW